MSTKWTDPTKVKNLYKSIKGTNPTRNQNSCSRSGRSQQGSKTYIDPQSGRTHEGLRFMFTKWTDLTRVKNLHKSIKGTDPTRNQNSCSRSGRSQQGSKSYIDPPSGRIHEGLRFMFTKWTDLTRVKNIHKSIKGIDPTRNQNSCPRSGQSQQGLKTYIGPQSGRTPRGIKIHVHKVDGPHEGSKFMSTKWTDSTMVKNLHKSIKGTHPTRN